MNCAAGKNNSCASSVPANSTRMLNRANEMAIRLVRTPTYRIGKRGNKMDKKCEHEYNKHLRCHTVLI